MRDTHEKFTLPTVGLHWVIAIAMIAMLIFGLYIEDLPRSAEKGSLIGLHKSIGLIVLVFAIVRIYWRHLNKFPKAITELPNWQEKIAKITHWVLLIGTVLMPISGIMMSIGGGHSIGVFGLEIFTSSGEKIEFLSEVGHIGHELGGNLLIIFILLHLIGAIKHQVIDKDGTISRMLGIHVETKK